MYHTAHILIAVAAALAAVPATAQSIDGPAPQQILVQISGVVDQSGAPVAGANQTHALRYAGGSAWASQPFALAGRPAAVVATVRREKVSGAYRLQVMIVWQNARYWAYSRDYPSPPIAAGWTDEQVPRRHPSSPLFRIDGSSCSVSASGL